MLTWGWLTALTIAGIALALACVARGRDRTRDDQDSTEMTLQLGAHAVLVIALVVSEKVPVMYAWLKSALPEHGSAVNELTALAITGVGCLAYAFGLPFAIMAAEFVRWERTEASRAARKVIEHARTR